MNIIMNAVKRGWLPKTAPRAADVPGGQSAVIALVVSFMTSAALAATNMTPIAVTGFNRDIVV